MCQDVLTLEEIYQAYTDCRKKKKNKTDAKKFEINALFHLQTLQMELNTRKYKVRPSQCFIVKYPTMREVFCAHFRDRIVQHLVYNELNPYMDKCFIYDAANCRVNKGTDFAIHRVERFIRSATKNNTEESFYAKIDLSGFFMSINRQLLLNKAIKFTESKYNGVHTNLLNYLLPIIILNDCTKNANKISNPSDWDKLPPNKTLFGNLNGLPIGNICSQLFANFYLNDIDHYLKSRHNFVSRYVDDIIIVDKDVCKLNDTLQMLSTKLEPLNLKINTKKTKISKCKYGVPFLGVKIYSTYTTLSKSRINRLYYSRKFLRREKAFCSISSRLGMIWRYHGWSVFVRWFTTLSNAIKDDIFITDSYRINSKIVNAKRINKTLIVI